MPVSVSANAHPADGAELIKSGAYHCQILRKWTHCHTTVRIICPCREHHGISGFHSVFVRKHLRVILKDHSTLEQRYAGVPLHLNLHWQMYSAVVTQLL